MGFGGISRHIHCTADPIYSPLRVRFVLSLKQGGQGFGHSTIYKRMYNLDSTFAVVVMSSLHNRRGKTCLLEAPGGGGGGVRADNELYRPSRSRESYARRWTSIYTSRTNRLHLRQQKDTLCPGPPDVQFYSSSNKACPFSTRLGQNNRAASNNYRNKARLGCKPHGCVCDTGWKHKRTVSTLTDLLYYIFSSKRSETITPTKVRIDTKKDMGGAAFAIFRAGLTDVVGNSLTYGPFSHSYEDQSALTFTPTVEPGIYTEVHT